jgi:hypothetical protein
LKGESDMFAKIEDGKITEFSFTKDKDDYVEIDDRLVSNAALRIRKVELEQFKQDWKKFMEAEAEYNLSTSTNDFGRTKETLEVDGAPLSDNSLKTAVAGFQGSLEMITLNPDADLIAYIDKEFGDEGFQIFTDYIEELVESVIKNEEVYIPEIRSEDYSDDISEESLWALLNEYADKEGNFKDYTSFRNVLAATVWDEWNDRIDFRSAEFGIDLYNKVAEIIEDKCMADFEKESVFYKVLMHALDVCRDCGRIEEIGSQYIEVDEESFIGEYDLTLFLSTAAELNLDFGSTHYYYHSLENVREDDAEELGDTALSYLIHQQGYKTSDVFEALQDEKKRDKAGKFIQSTAEEIENMTYTMSNLVVLVKLNRDNIYDFAEALKTKEGFIRISAKSKAELGLFDRWDGSGSPIEIKLEKDFVFPADMIQYAFIEEAKPDSSYDYSVKNVYGLGSSAWKDGMSISEKEDVQLVKEDFKKTTRRAIKAEKENRKKDDYER